MKRLKFMPLWLFTLLTLFNTSIVFANIGGISQSSVEQKLMQLETSMEGRIGISVLNMPQAQQNIQYRAEERFPLQSTVKVMIVAAILQKSMSDNKLLAQKVNYKKEDLVSWSPITEKHLAEGMSISELCAAAIMYTDNTATNLLMKELGGPEAVTAFARSIGDQSFRLDNWEPELNSNPHDEQDSSTPKAMATGLQQLTLGNILAPEQREQLLIWMKDNTTGDARIRAGVPKGWIVADKTGAGSYGVTNDIGIINPPKCPPFVVAIYFFQNKKEVPRRDEAVAQAMRILIDEFTLSDQCIKEAIASGETSKKTKRFPQFSNEKVNVWETIVYPGGDQKLPPHRHEYDRVLVALDDGILKVTNNKNETYLLEVSKNKAYFLKKDSPKETHVDVNITDHPMRFMVIELK